MDTPQIRKNKLYEDIVQTLLERIREGSLRAGDRLPAERTLASDLGVSRTAIREALRSLEHMGCIESRVGEGTFIKSPRFEDIAEPFSMVFSQDRQLNSDLIEARLILETEIARLAARRRTPAQLEELRATIATMEQNVRGGGNAVDADDAFHAVLAQAAGNSALNTILGMCAQLLSRTRRITQNMQGVPEATLSDHRAILDAVERQDEKAAYRLMRRHLINAQKNLLRRK